MLDGELIAEARHARCKVDWNGRYRCRSVACATCRLTHQRREVRVASRLFYQHSDACWAGFSVRVGDTPIQELLRLFQRSQDHLRARVKASKKRSRRWSGIRLKCWLQVSTSKNSVGEDQWTAYLHIAAALESVSFIDLRDALRTQWGGDLIKCTEFYRTRSGVVELRKFVAASADVFRWASGADRDAELRLDHVFRQARSRSMFEGLRFSVGFAEDRRRCNEIRAELDAMPFTCSFSGDAALFDGWGCW